MYFLLVLLPMLATAKMLLQARLSRTEVVTVSDAFRLNGFVFLFSGLVLAALFFRTLPSFPAFLAGLLLAAVNFLFQFCYVQAFKRGAASLTMTVSNFAVLIPLLAGAFFFEDALSPLNIVGLPLLLVAFALLPMREENKKCSFSLHWFLFAAFAAIFSGVSSAVLLWISRTELEICKSEILVINYLFSALLAFCLSARPEKRSAFRATRKSIGACLLIGILLGFFHLLSMFAVKEISATVYYPVTTVLVILLSLAADRIFFHQKFGKKAVIGCCFALASILLLSL